MQDFRIDAHGSDTHGLRSDPTRLDIRPTRRTPSSDTAGDLVAMPASTRTASRFRVLKRAITCVLLLAAPFASRAIAQQACQEQEVFASDEAPGDNFGNDIAVLGEDLFIGSWHDDGSGSPNLGSVYVFRWDGTQWVQRQKLLPWSGPPGDQQFGESIHAGGNNLVVGASLEDSFGSASGAAYVFQFDGTEWVAQQKLVAADPAPDRFFGSSVRIWGDVIVVGSWGDDSFGTNTGAAYVFRRNGTQWVQEQKLFAADPVPGDEFARAWSSVGVYADRIVAGAWLHDHGGADRGAAYVYRYDGAAWVVEAELLASDGQAGDYFGSSVGMQADTIVVGAPGEANGAGAAYVFRFDGTNWIESQKLVAADGAAGASFGSNVALDVDRIIVAARADVGNGSGSGAVYVFHWNGTQWVQAAKLAPSDGRVADAFGGEAAIDGDRIFVGSLFHDDRGTDSGSAYFFRWSPDDCNGNGIADACDIADGTSSDCNGNGIPDECDIGSGSSADCNGNGIPDECDLDPNDPDGNGQVSDDCNGNGVPDECESTGVVISVWTGNGDGTSWSDPANWCPAVVPADDPNAGLFFDVRIPGSAQVVADLSVSVSSLDVDPNAEIDINATGGRTLKISQPNRFTNDGLIDVFSHGNRLEAAGVVLNTNRITIRATQGTASFVPTAAGTVLAGGGVLELASTTSAILGSSDGAVSLTNDPNHCIRGEGQIVGNFTNRGLVEANTSNGAIRLHGVGTVRTNSHMMRAVGGGTLRISGRLNQDPNAALEVNGTGGTRIVIGDPNDPNTIVNGGTIRRLNGQINVRAAARLRDLTVVGGLSVPAGQTAVFEGTITNQGTISIGGGSTVLVRDLDATFAGSAGVIELRSQGTAALARIESSSPLRTLTNGAGHTIQGVGRITAGLVNEGQIIATRLSGTSPALLVLDADDFFGPLPLTNNATGRIEANNATILQINRPLTNHGQLVAGPTGIVNINANVNSDGQIEADAGGTVHINSAVSGGGTLVVAGGTMQVTATTDAGCVEVPPNGFAATGTSQLLVQSASLTAADLSVRTEGVVRIESGATCQVATDVLLDTADPARPPMLRVAAGGMLRFGTGQTGGQGMLNAGTARIDGTLEAASNDPLDILIQGGTLGGTGSVIANVNVVGGQIDPGSDPNAVGTLIIQRSLAMLGGATLHFDLAGRNGNHDRIDVTGTAQLGGTLEVTLVGGFQPQDGDAFTLLTATGGVSGAFANTMLPTPPAGLEWTVDIQPDRVIAQLGQGGPPPCDEDITGDGQIDLADLAVLLNNFGSNGTHADGDIDGDGDIDLSDLALLLNVFGSPCP